MTRDAFIVVQTHWDREWYYTHQQFIARLLTVVPSILGDLESDGLDNFLFDGQTAAVEDLLENAETTVVERTHKLLQMGKIAIGPWYVMSDEFLCNGECLIRNLEEGIETSIGLGGLQKVGYLPDTFGHIGQMPQILQGFEIDSSVVWRGVDIKGDAFEWQAPDGSSVFTVFLPLGYYQHPFNKNDNFESVTKYFDDLEIEDEKAPLLLTQGGDHLVSAESIKSLIAQYNESQDKYALKNIDLQGFIEISKSSRSKAIPKIVGELKENKRAFVLPDVLSTRQHLKEANQLAEDKLLGGIEPLLAMTPFKDNYPHKYLKETWKLLLQQHAHDSICGCSIDEVHQEMDVRFLYIRDRFHALQKLSSDTLQLASQYMNTEVAQHAFADDRKFTLFNPSPKQRTGWFDIDLFLEGPKQDITALKDANGSVLQFIVTESLHKPKFVSPLDDFPEHVDGYWYKVKVWAELAGLTSLALTVESVDSKKDSLVANTSNSIENAIYRIEVNNNQIKLTDIQQGTIVENILSINSTLDAGDTYNYSPPKNQQLQRATITACNSINHDGQLQQLIVDIALQQPESLSSDRSGPSNNRVESTGQLIITLLKNDSLIDCKLHWDNKAKDHRLRLNFPLQKKITTTVSDSAFELCQRDVVYDEKRTDIDKTETRVSVNPSHSMIQAGAVTVCHRALQEFEIIDGGSTEDFLGVTLLRCVGWLSRRDVVTRGVGAGPDLATPEAQEIGPHHYHFKFSYNESLDAITALNLSQEFRRPPMLLAGHTDLWNVPFTLKTDVLQVSSLRRIGNEIELRLWNPSDSKTSFELSGRDWRRVRLNGSDDQDQSSEVHPCGIVTLRMDV